MQIIERHGDIYMNKQDELEQSNYGKVIFENKADFYYDIKNHKYNIIRYIQNIPSINNHGFSVLFSANINNVALKKGKITFEGDNKNGFASKLTILNNIKATKYLATDIKNANYGFEVYYFLQIEDCPETLILSCYKNII